MKVNLLMQKIKVYVIGLLFFCILFSVSIIVKADGESVETAGWLDNKYDIFEDLDYDVGEGSDSDYYTNKISQHLSLENRFGTSKDLVIYRGEYPYTLIDDKKSTSGVFTRRGNLSKDGDKAKEGVSPDDYWGTGTIGELNGTKEDSEDLDEQTVAASLNNKNIRSARLFSLTHVGASGNWIYSITKGIARLPLWVCSLIIKIKSIDLTEITSHIVGVSNLTETVNRFFIMDGNSLSPILLISIISLILATVGAIIHFVRGDKNKSWLDILVPFFIGIFIIGTALTNKTTSLANSASNLASALIGGINSLNNDDNEKAWQNNLTDINKQSELNSLALLRKPFVDAQICEQFGVSKIEELDFENLGDTQYGAYTKKISQGGLLGNNSKLTKEEFSAEFSHNLGYYFWYANSGAAEYGTNGKYVKVSGNPVKKTSYIITYLQTRLNVENLDSKQRTRIEGIISSLSNPSGLSAALSFILFTIVYIILALCLIKYALKILLNKAFVSITILALPVSGVLYISANKKLIGIAKNCLGFIVLSLIKLITYATIFDVSLFLIGSLIKVDIISLMVALAISIIFYIIQPVMETKLNSLLDRVGNKLSPEYTNAKNRLRNNMYVGLQQRANATKRIKYVDDLGNEHYKTKATWGARLATLGANKLDSNKKIGETGLFKQAKLNSPHKIENKDVDQKLTDAKLMSNLDDYNSAKSTVDDFNKKIERTALNPRLDHSQSKINALNNTDLSKEKAIINEKRKLAQKVLKNSKDEAAREEAKKILEMSDSEIAKMEFKDKHKDESVLSKLRNNDSIKAEKEAISEMEAKEFENSLGNTMSKISDANLKISEDVLSSFAGKTKYTKQLKKAAKKESRHRKNEKALELAQNKYAEAENYMSNQKRKQKI